MTKPEHLAYVGPQTLGFLLKAAGWFWEKDEGLVQNLMGISFTPSLSSAFLQNNSVSNQRSSQTGVDSEVTWTGLLGKDAGGFLSLRRSLT